MKKYFGATAIVAGLGIWAHEAIYPSMYYSPFDRWLMSHGFADWQAMSLQLAVMATLIAIGIALLRRPTQE